MSVLFAVKPGRWLAVGLGLAAAALTAGCGVATPASADYAGGPVSEPPHHLSAFPQPQSYVGGLNNTGYQTVAGVVTGTAPRKVTVTAASTMVLWLGCAGTAGTAEMTSPPLGLRWSVPCGSTGDPQGIEFQPSTGVGHAVKILVTSTAGTKWELRVDGPRHGS
jgi:hypothetical protein